MLNLSFVVIATFTGLFTQINVSKIQNDTVKGRFYMNPPSYYLMHVNYPVDQVLFNRGDTTFIYYPETKEGFKLISNYSNSPEVSKSLIPVFKDEYLTKLGMILVKSNYKNGVLTKYYSPTDSKSKLKFIKIVYKNHLINRIEVIDRDNNVVKRSVYGNYKRVNNRNIPMRIKNYSRINKDSAVSQIDYDSVIYREKLPDSIENYKIPPEIKLKEMKW
ncbi:outer-membrane lipoprotein carrier protein LolA [candidate division WOR-3 bacterium]|nr:outer-membrane lipoprotein carrier protein LolA [candidate division WOR-3 bacterium]